MATVAATLLSTTWTNPCGKSNTPTWTLWTTPTPVPSAPTLFWADNQPSSCYPPSFSAMSWGNVTYSPGVCPSGYTTAKSSSNSQNKETNAVCCPSGFSLYSINLYGLDCWTSFSSGSPGTAIVLWQAGGGTSSQTMAFTSGAANGYSINIAWKAADFTISESSKTSGSSSTSGSGSGSNSNTSRSSSSGDNTSSGAGGLGKGSKIGLGVGLGIGLPLVLVLIGAWIFRSRMKARSIPPVTVAEEGMPELNGDETVAAAEKNLPELDSAVGEVGELETRGNAAELDGTGRDGPRELDGQAARSG
ncbi:hypothetical protein GQ44DRAFT_826650 [Phaeosphaeriaceae sp. PMI808]|nr:hypothetical protein GQ44DRAFT_826650 [Phaeosphaeriaceae sp. PMI808]